MQRPDITLIDTHCHLYAAEFDTDRDLMIERALENGVGQMMLPNIDEHSMNGMWHLVEKYPGHCFPMIGLHPCSVREDYQDHLNRMKLDLVKRTYVGIGETGVDLYWDKTFQELQIDAFEQQIGWGIESELPVIIHSRESLDLNIGIVTKLHQAGLKGIFHCFGGTYDQAMHIHEMGFKIGIGGVATYKKSGLDELLPLVPPAIIVLETDAPYLTPVPHRGKRNESAYLRIIAERVAFILGKSLEEVAEQTSRNAFDVFGKKV